jgi:hypothetical protein
MARKGHGRQSVARKNADLEHLLSGDELLAICKAAPICDSDDARRRRLRHVVHADQGGHIDDRTDLLHTLPDRGRRRVFVMVHEAAGQAPQAEAGLDRSTAENDPPFHLDDHGGRDLRIAPQDEVVIRTRFQLTTFDHPGYERRAAPDAVVAHRGRA